MEPVGIGFVGAGFAAELHAHALAPLRGSKCELVAVASRTRERAEAFAKRFGAQSSYVIASEIPGKGTWYRVRVGDYATAKDAIAAKAAFEKQHSVIAYVVGH
jgi:ornithine cyclodeaminase/alanine dehydrogenase-like protein (mu-crystallin family)